jgi:hypothetical protein
MNLLPSNMDVLIVSDTMVSSAVAFGASGPIRQGSKSASDRLDKTLMTGWRGQGLTPDGTHNMASDTCGMAPDLRRVVEHIEEMLSEYHTQATTEQEAVELRTTAARALALLRLLSGASATGQPAEGFCREVLRYPVLECPTRWYKGRYTQRRPTRHNQLLASLTPHNAYILFDTLTLAGIRPDQTLHSQLVFTHLLQQMGGPCVSNTAPMLPVLMMTYQYVIFDEKVSPSVHLNLEWLQNPGRYQRRLMQSSAYLQNKLNIGTVGTAPGVATPFVLLTADPDSVYPAPREYLAVYPSRETEAAGPNGEEDWTSQSERDLYSHALKVRVKPNSVGTEPVTHTFTPETASLPEAHAVLLHQQLAEIGVQCRLDDLVAQTDPVCRRMASGYMEPPAQELSAELTALEERIWEAHNHITSSCDKHDVRRFITDYIDAVDTRAGTASVPFLTFGLLDLLRGYEAFYVEHGQVHYRPVSRNMFASMEAVASKQASGRPAPDIASVLYTDVMMLDVVRSLRHLTLQEFARLRAREAIWRRQNDELLTALEQWACSDTSEDACRAAEGVLQALGDGADTAAPQPHLRLRLRPHRTEDNSWVGLRGMIYDGVRVHGKMVASVSGAKLYVQGKVFDYVFMAVDEGCTAQHILDAIAHANLQVEGSEAGTETDSCPTGCFLLAGEDVLPPEASVLDYAARSKRPLVLCDRPRPTAHMFAAVRRFAREAAGAQGDAAVRLRSTAARVADRLKEVGCGADPVEDRHAALVPSALRALNRMIHERQGGAGGGNVGLAFLGQDSLIPGIGKLGAVCEDANILYGSLPAGPPGYANHSLADFFRISLSTSPSPRTAGTRVPFSGLPTGVLDCIVGHYCRGGSGGVARLALDDTVRSARNKHQSEHVKRKLTSQATTRPEVMVLPDSLMQGVNCLSGASLLILGARTSVRSLRQWMGRLHRGNQPGRLDVHHTSLSSVFAADSLYRHLAGALCTNSLVRYDAELTMRQEIYSEPKYASDTGMQSLLSGTPYVESAGNVSRSATDEAWRALCREQARWNDRDARRVATAEGAKGSRSWFANTTVSWREVSALYKQIRESAPPCMQLLTLRANATQAAQDPAARARAALAERTWCDIYTNVLAPVMDAAKRQHGQAPVVETIMRGRLMRDRVEAAAASLLEVTSRHLNNGTIVLPPLALRDNASCFSATIPASEGMLGDWIDVTVKDNGDDGVRVWMEERYGSPPASGPSSFPSLFQCPGPIGGASPPPSAGGCKRKRTGDDSNGRCKRIFNL